MLEQPAGGRAVTLLAAQSQENDHIHRYDRPVIRANPGSTRPAAVYESPPTEVYTFFVHRHRVGGGWVAGGRLVGGGWAAGGWYVKCDG
jgi:hypothetical protein